MARYAGDGPAGVYFNAQTGMDGDDLTENPAKFLRQFLVAFEQWIALFGKGAYSK